MIFLGIVKSDQVKVYLFIVLIGLNYSNLAGGL